MGRLLLPAVVLLVCSSCRDFTGPEVERDIVGVVWSLRQFQQPDGLRRDSGTLDITLLLQDNGSVTGRAFTISDEGEEVEHFTYDTVYDLSGTNRLSVGVPVLDRPFPFMPFNNRWGEYERALHLAESYESDGDELVISYDNGWALLYSQYVAPEPD